MATRRTYRMTARAESARVTGERIVRAVEELFVERCYDELSLEQIAQRAGVTVQTLIRRFGSKEGLVAAAAARITEAVVAQRSQAPIGDVEGAVENLLEHYESVGRLVLRLLQQEHVPTLARIAEGGRKVHRRWVARTLGPLLSKLPVEERRMRLDQLTVLTDVYIWKLLRLDLGRSRAQVQKTLVDMLQRASAESGQWRAC
ncbi:MAG: TetR/AcrR family transcriptional regulator [Myxococcota bacterium]